MPDLFSSVPPPMSGPYRVPPCQHHSATSHQAAAEIEPYAGSQRARVLAVLRAAGADGLTDQDIEDQLFMSGSTARPRRLELMAAGHVRDSGRTRATRSGKQAVVWVANTWEHAQS